MKNVVLIVLFFSLVNLGSAQSKESSMDVQVSTSKDSSGHTNISVSLPNLGSIKFHTIKGRGEVLELDSFYQGGRAGRPELPYRSVSLLVPPDADLDNIQAELIGGFWEKLPGIYDIAAVQPATTWYKGKFLIDWPDENAIVAGRDMTVYERDDYFPSKSVEVISAGSFRRWKLVELKVWLASYNPVQKRVRILRDGQIELSMQRSTRALKDKQRIFKKRLTPRTEKFVIGLLNSIDNPNDLDTFYGGAEQSGSSDDSGDEIDLGETSSGANFDYIIITTSAIQNNSTKLADFISTKQNLGYRVKVVTEASTADDTHYESGADSDQRANNIRAWLQSYWESDGIEYLLLIGHPHPTFFSSTKSVPMKMCWPRHGYSGPEIAPTDMFYAELSGDWDLDGDGYYGEYSDDYGSGGADKHCELKVGRIPFYGSYVHLDSILQKSIDYMTASGDLDWRKSVLIPAAVSNFGPQDNNGDGDADDPGDFSSPGHRTFADDWAEYIKLQASSIGFDSYSLYEREGVYDDGSAYPLIACDASLTKDNIVSEWQSKYGFVAWWAHGNGTSASRLCWISDNEYPDICNKDSETTWYTMFQSEDCLSLSDKHPSFVAQASCSNGYPENSWNLGYSLLKRGAIGTFSGTRATFYSLGSWNTNIGLSYGDNASYGYYCFKRMSEFDDSSGAALQYCRSNFGTGWYSGSSWMNMLTMNLYGDPELSLVSAQPNVYFADPNLKAAVEQELGIVDPTASDMLALTVLDANSRAITDLTGLEYATNLTCLGLADNEINDISLVSELTSLTHLYLNGNQIDDIFLLSELTELMVLELHNNQLSDISPLSKLYNLAKLSLHENPLNKLAYCTYLSLISANNPGINLTYDPDPNPEQQCPDVEFLDINLKLAVEEALGVSDPNATDMLSLTELYANSREIIDLTGLEYAANLTILYLYDNQISDMSVISGLTNLERLYLYENQISDISAVAGLSNLDRLYLYDNQISDISAVAGLTNLERLYLYENQIEETSALSELMNLQRLFLQNNPLNKFAYCFYLPLILDNNPGIILSYDPDPNPDQECPVSFSDPNLKAYIEQVLGVTDPTPTDMLTIYEFNAEDKGIVDLSGLEFGMNLTHLYLNDNNINDISVLSVLTNLRELYLYNNNIEVISAVSRMTNLERLYLYENQIQDISPVSGLASLERLYLHDNNINDISALSGLTNLKRIYLYNNNISDISALLKHSNLERLFIFGNPLNTAAYCRHIPAITFNNSGITISYDPNPNPLTEDCATNLENLGEFVQHWLETGCNEQNNWCGGADLDHLNSVTLKDLAEFGRYWIQVPAQ